MFRYFPYSFALVSLALVSCSNEPVRNYETGSIMKVKMATVEKVHKFSITRDAAGEGTFAEMASNTATAITPGLLASGTSKIASATGSIMDSKIETVAKVRIRVRVDSDPVETPKDTPKAETSDNQLAEAEPPKQKPGELIEIIQNDIPGLAFHVGQRVVISTGSTPGNAWPE